MNIERVYQDGLLVREVHIEGAANYTTTAYVPGNALAKEAQGYDVAALQLIKSSDEYRVTLGVAYPANKVDEKLAKDGYHDFAAPDLVEQIAWRWMKERQQIGLLHERGTEGHGIVVESGIHRGPDWIVKTAGGESVVREGDWLLATEWDAPTWSLIKARRLRGWSPQGSAVRKQPSADALAGLRRA